MAESHVHRLVCIASARNARLPSEIATHRFARASSGMTTTDAAATMMPGIVLCGCSRRYSDRAASMTM